MNEQVKRDGKFNCEVCGKEKAVRYFKPDDAYRFCSRKCQGIGMSGESHPRYNGGRVMSKEEGYWIILAPKHPRANAGGYVPEHILRAEAALGHYLPEGAVVHHANGNKSDNRNENLVILPNLAYHILIHARMRRKQKYGDPNLKRCGRCKKVIPLRDFPVNPKIYEGRDRLCETCYRGEGNNSTKTHCKRGHPFDAINTHIAPDGKRSCRICHKNAADALRSKASWENWQARHYFDQIGLGV